MKGPFENAFARPKREYKEPSEVRSGGGGGGENAAGSTRRSSRDGETSSGRLGSYFSSASSRATGSGGSVRRAQPVDPDWDS